MHNLRQNLLWFKCIFLLPKNGEDFENEVLQKKNIMRSVPLFLLHRNLRFGTEHYVVF